MRLKDGMIISCTISGVKVNRALVGHRDGKVIVFFNSDDIKDSSSNGIDPNNGYGRYYRMNLYVDDDLESYSGFVKNIKELNANPNYDLID